MKIKQDSYHQWITMMVICIEAIMAGLLFYGLFAMTHDSLSQKVFIENVRQVMMTLSLCYLITAFQVGVVLYKRKVFFYQIFSRILRNTLYFGTISAIVLSLGHYMDVASSFYFIYLGLMFVGSFLFRLTLRILLKTYRARGGNLRYVVLVGSTANNQELFKELTCQAWTGYRVKGYFDFVEKPAFSQNCPYLGEPKEVMEYLRKNNGVHHLFCCLPSKDRDTILPIINFCENNLVHFYSVPNLHNYLHNRVFFNMMGDVPYLSLHQDPLNSVGNRFIKRAFDIVFSLTFLCTVFPFILLIVTIITKITMPSPIFFRQKRNGLNDKEFYCYKFRSMKVNKDADKVQATKDDPRKTKWGNIMRKTSIDELPQFINVLMGDMSVVGPRPHMLKHTEEYSKLIDKYMIRHFVKPGITGWSQVIGFRGETKELKDMEGRIKGDIWYIEHWTFGLDLYCIYKTVANAIQGEKNAY